jgi:hypothetical protein
LIGKGSQQYMTLDAGKNWKKLNGEGVYQPVIMVELELPFAMIYETELHKHRREVQKKVLCIKADGGSKWEKSR